jgi:uncharacterized protein YllA (UPF0747 family)
MEHYAVEFVDCLQGKDLVVEKMLRSSGHSDAIAAIRHLREYLSDELEELRPDAVSVDATLGPALDNARRKILHNVDRLLRQSIRMETSQDRIVQEDAGRLLNTCYPNNNLQERVFGIYAFIARHGPSLIDKIHSLIRLDGFAHQVVRLE